MPARRQQDRRPRPSDEASSRARSRDRATRGAEHNPQTERYLALQQAAGNRAVQRLRERTQSREDGRRHEDTREAGRLPVQRDRTPTYEQQAGDVSGQRPGQTREERVGEMAGELTAETRQGAEGARGDWGREMAVFRANVDAIYTKMEGAHRVVSEALYEAWENHNGVLNEIKKAREMRAAIAGAIIGIGLSVVSAGAGSLAGATMGRVAGRFANAEAYAGAHKAISDMLVESFKQGIQAGGGAILKPNVATPPTLGNVDSPRQFKDKGLSAIRNELADIRNIIRWLENNRDRLEEGVTTDTECLPGSSPILWVDRHAQEWGEMLAGAEGMIAGADTKKMEIEIWRPWIQQHGATNPEFMARAYGVRPDLTRDVKKYVVKHLRDNLGVSEAQIRSWAGLS